MNWYKKSQLIKQADRSNYLINKLKYPSDVVEWANSISKQIEPKGIYIQWIAKQAINNIIKPAEDDSKILEKLSLFYKLSKNKKIDIKDINQFKTYGDLAKYLAPYNMQSAASGRAEQKRLTVEGAVSVYKDDKVEIIRLDTEQAASNLCRKTEWCIKDPEFFNKYGAPFYMIYLNNNGYALLHNKSGQFKDVYDNSIDLKSMAPIINSLKLFIDQNPGVISIDIGIYDNELNIITEAIDTKNNINNLIGNNKQDMEEDFINMLRSEGITYYFYIDDENKTDNILNYVTHYYEKKLLDSLEDDNKRDTHNPLNIYNPLNVYKEIPSEIIPRISSKVVNAIIKNAKSQFEEHSYVYNNFSDSLKNLIGQDEIMQMWIKEIKRMKANDYSVIPEDIFNSIPKNEKKSLINQYIFPSVIGDYHIINNEWGRIPNFIKNLFSPEDKTKIAERILYHDALQQYHTMGMAPSLPEDLVPYASEASIIKAWDKMLEGLPEQFYMVPDEFKNKVSKKSLLTGWMKTMSFHSISTYPTIPIEIREQIPLDWVKERFIENMKRVGLSFYYYSQYDWDSIKSILSDKEILNIIEQILKNSMIGKYEKYNDYIVSINKLPAIYRDYFLQNLDTMYKENQMEQTNNETGAKVYSNWYKKSQYNFPNVGDVQKIMSIDSILVGTETIEDIRYDLFKSIKDNKGIIRVFDLDANESVSLMSFVDFDSAKEKYIKTIELSKM